MTEKASDRIERLALQELNAGDVLVIMTGDDKEGFTYTFAVEEPGRWPVGHMQEVDPAGTITGTGTFMLQGSGVWTNRRQNPVQSQERAFTSDFCDLSLGTYLVGSAPNNPALRSVFDNPNQAICEISVTRAG